MNKIRRHFEKRRNIYRSDLNLGWFWFRFLAKVHGIAIFHLKGGQHSAGCFALVRFGRRKVWVAWRSAEMYQRGYRPRLRSLTPRQFWREYENYYYPRTPTAHQRLALIADRGRSLKDDEDVFKFVGIPQ